MSLTWKKVAEDLTANEINIHVEDIEPELFIRFQHLPTLKTYSGLLKKLKDASDQWMLEFLQLGGLSIFFEVLGKLSDRGLLRFTDAFLQLECVQCIKTVLNSETGLKFMVQSEGLTRQLVIGKCTIPVCCEMYLG